jgi:hypothetical protein
MSHRTIKVPRLFYEDHVGRAANEGDAKCISTDRNRVTLEMDNRSQAALFADAQWYADTKSHDSNWPALVRSARATVIAMTL